MRFTLEIELGNEAMQAPGDVAEALRVAANNLADDDRIWEDDTRQIRDVYGNTVGAWTLRGRADDGGRS